VDKLKMLFVLAAIALGLLLLLVVGILIHPNDGKQPTGGHVSHAEGADAGVV
jgi:hypothetical protein